jgi:hypothetical protein
MELGRIGETELESRTAKLAKARERQPPSLLDLRCRRRTAPSSRPEIHVQYSAAWSSLPSEQFRVVVCGRCRVQLRLCARCDRGHRFCRLCGPVQRRESVRRAGAAYRIAPRSRRLQATRQARYRERQAKFAVQKVTHQSVTEADVPSTAPVPLEIDSGRKDPDDRSNRNPDRCSFCRAWLPVWARSEPRCRYRARRTPRPPRGPPLSP